MRSLGGYEILHSLSQGGMGEVLLARRRGPGGFDRVVAMKTIRAELAGAAVVRSMFLDEAKLLAQLSHPAVATVFDFGEEDGVLYLVMEYVAGVSLRTLAERAPSRVVIEAVAEAARGLHAAHELRDLGGQALGVVHRDVSPDNLLVGFDGHVKVIDFGIALVKGRQAPVTEIGTLKGKPPYMSPEQLKNEAIDRRSDVWSLGVVLHELLTQQALFAGDSIYAVARAIEHMDIPAPRDQGAASTPELDAVVLSALTRNRAERTPSALDFADRLTAATRDWPGPTLKAWAQTHLREASEVHREFLARIVGGETQEPGGRRTGVVTAVAPSVQAPASVCKPLHEPVASADADAADADPDADPDAATDDDDERRSPRPAKRRWPWLAVALVVGTAAVLGGLWGQTSQRSPAREQLAVVAADAAVAVPPAPVDASAVPVDGAVASDPAGAPAREPRSSSKSKVVDTSLGLAAARARWNQLLEGRYVGAVWIAAGRDAVAAAQRSGVSPRRFREMLAKRGPVSAEEDTSLVDPSLPFRAARELWNDASERRYVTKVFADAERDVSRAAVHAGVAPRHFGGLLEKHGVAHGGRHREGPRPNREPREREVADMRKNPQTPTDTPTDTPVPPSPVPTGEGRISITADPFVNIRIDGVDVGPTPYLRKPLSAGRHEVVLLSPDGGKVLLRRTVEVAAGATVRIVYP